MTKYKVKGVTFNIRKDTKDKGIVDHIFKENRYKFPDDMTGVTVLDIGGHIGSASLYCATKGAKVITFEPYKPNFNLLVKNTKGYEVECHNFGIGDEGIRELFILTGNTGARCLYPEFFDNLVGEPSVKVEIKSIEPYLTKEVYIKMDCEGAECEIFPIIEKHVDKVKMIFCEIHREVEYWVQRMLPYYDIEQLSNCEFKMTRR